MGSPDSNESLQKKLPAVRPHSDLTPDQGSREARGSFSRGEGMRKTKAARRNSFTESRRSDSGHDDNASNREATQLGFPAELGQNTLGCNSNVERQVLLDQMIIQRLQDGIQPVQLFDLQISGLLSRAQQQFGPQSLNLHGQHELLMLHRDRHQRASLAVASTAASTRPLFAFIPQTFNPSVGCDRRHLMQHKSSTDSTSSFMNSNDNNMVAELLRRELLDREVAIQQQRHFLERYLLSSQNNVAFASLRNFNHGHPTGIGGSVSNALLQLHLQRENALAATSHYPGSGILHSNLPTAAFPPPPPPFSRSPTSVRNVVPLSISTDFDKLSSYQVLVREQMELFVAKQEDVITIVQGRKQGVVMGQVGVRCRHCAHLSLRQRGRGSAYYPKKLEGIYQAVQNMSATHLQVSCTEIPVQIRQDLAVLHQRREMTVGGKAYWVEAGRSLGVVEDEIGLRFDDRR